MITVLLVDDHEMLRAGFKMLIDNQPDLQVVGQASTGSQALIQVNELRPDVVLMDVEMPDMDGIAATQAITEDPETQTRVLILTTFHRSDYLFASLRAGASGFLLKTAPAEQLVDAVRVIADGRSLLDPTVTGEVIRKFALAGPGVARSEHLDALTSRELDVLASLAGGLSNAEIAQELHVGETTVKSHVSNVLMKLGLRDRVQAVVFAYEHGLVQPGD